MQQDNMMLYQRLYQSKTSQSSDLNPIVQAVHLLEEGTDTQKIKY